MSVRTFIGCISVLETRNRLQIARGQNEACGSLETFNFSTSETASDYDIAELRIGYIIFAW